jgi:hypothetical protein
VQSGIFDALTTDYSILAAYASQEQYKGKFQLAGLKLSNENYGIGVQEGSELKAEINTALEKMVSDKSWDKAVKDNLGPANYKNEPAPKIGNPPFSSQKLRKLPCKVCPVSGKGKPPAGVAADVTGRKAASAVRFRVVSTPSSPSNTSYSVPANSG